MTQPISRAAILEWLAEMRARLEEAASALRSRFPSTRINAMDLSFGSDEYSGQSVVLEAVLPSLHSVALVVSVPFLTSIPRVFADVCWDAEGPGGVEAETYSDWENSRDWPIASSENVRQVEEQLPALTRALENAIERALANESQA